MLEDQACDDGVKAPACEGQPRGIGPSVVRAPASTVGLGDLSPGWIDSDRDRGADSERESSDLTLAAAHVEDPPATRQVIGGQRKDLLLVLGISPLREAVLPPARVHLPRVVALGGVILHAASIAPCPCTRGSRQYLRLIMAEHSRHWETALPRSWGDRARSLAIPVLLVAVASLGVHRTVTLDQSSWQGVTFGMFATYDNTVSRMVRVTVTRPDGDVRVVLPDHLDDDARRLRVVPTRENADGLARSVMDLVRAEGALRVTVEVVRLRLRDADGALGLRLERLTVGSATR